MLKLHPRYLGMQSGAQGGDLKAGGPPGQQPGGQPFAVPPRVLSHCSGVSLTDPHWDKKAAPHLTARLTHL